MATIKEIKDQLTAKGVEFDPNALKPTLEGLLAMHPDAVVDTAAEPEPIVTPSKDRQKRWDAFLKEARSQRPDPTIFDAQMAKGEFDKIPDTFI